MPKSSPKNNNKKPKATPSPQTSVHPAHPSPNQSPRPNQTTTKNELSFCSNFFSAKPILPASAGPTVSHHRSAPNSKTVVSPPVRTKTTHQTQPTALSEQPTNHQWYPTNIVSLIRDISQQPSPTLKTPTFHFQNSKEAATHNWNILLDHNLNLGQALRAQPFSPLSPGSEFRHPSILEPILNQHPLWPQLRNELTEGTRFPLEPLSEEKRKKDIQEAIAFGNHKGVRDNKKIFNEIMENDVKRGW